MHREVLLIYTSSVTMLVWSRAARLFGLYNNLLPGTSYLYRTTLYEYEHLSIAYVALVFSYALVSYHTLFEPYD